ncbi:hypothetical protein [Leptothoe sp. PORK10 BA2]|uniref:hypothetical protein n=1 Tax=Leptothoe sp. PORK10 BA2 TaxID=3110254 RepID=UPI002B205F1E|nr:hypothetical protein [Leptothoe sp. PORK10 BA2]MEA5464507.1 hypothetical protein [Leptothoe sp. PORK10 BA2]
MDLLGQSQELAPPRKRVDGITVFRRFTQSIQDNGGDNDAFQKSIVEETRELFDCEVDELYRGTGGKRGKRNTLPQAAQEAYMVNESLSANELERMHGTIGGETQQEVNEKIQAVVREQAKQTRKWLPW